MEKLKYNKRLPCGSIFKSPVIRVDGSVTVCNYDLSLELKLGNIKENNIFELWESEKIKKLREKHILNQELPEKCRKCVPDFVLSREHSVKYMKKNNMNSRITEFLVRTAEKPSILLVNPLVSPKAPYKTTVTLGLGCLASYIKDYYKVEIINMNYSNIDNYELVKYASKEKFNVIGVTAMTYQVEGALRLCELVKEVIPDCITVMGGVFATMNHEYIMKHNSVDFVIKGEGEKPLLNFLKALEQGKTDFENIKSIVWRDGKKVVVNPPEDFLEADEIPIVIRKIMPTYGFIFDDSAFENTPDGKVSAVVMFSRGCPGNCIFCESPHMWKRKVRIMSIERIIKELKLIIAEFNLRNFVIDDDAFTADKDKVVEFCNRIIEEDLNIKWRCNTKVTMIDRELLFLMKSAGCVKVTYGIESGNPEVLKKLNKEFTVEDVRNALRLNKETGVPGSMLMIIGSPGETPQTVNDSVNLIEELEPEGGFDFQIMQPHPGTTLRRGLKFFGGTILTDDWDEYFSDNITYIPENFSKEEFALLCKKVTKRPIKMASFGKLSFSEKQGNIIKIPVDMWEDSLWNRLNTFYWKGEETFHKGYTHVLGADYGFITYNFNVSKIPQIVKIRFTACSQSLEQSSKVYVSINNMEICDVIIGEKDSEGYDYEIFCGVEKTSDINFSKGINEIRFEIKKDKMANGISIMYKALENSSVIREKPIIIELIS